MQDNLNIEKAKSCVRNEGAAAYWYIDPNQFAFEESDERDEQVSRDPDVDIRMDDEMEAKKIARRLAKFLGHRVIVQKFIPCGALSDNWEEDEDAKVTVMPWSN